MPVHNAGITAIFEKIAGLLEIQFERRQERGGSKNLSGRSPEGMQWNPGALLPPPPNPGFRCATSGLHHFHFFILACAVPAARLRGITSLRALRVSPLLAIIAA